MIRETIFWQEVLSKMNKYILRTNLIRYSDYSWIEYGHYRINVNHATSEISLKKTPCMQYDV